MRRYRPRDFPYTQGEWQGLDQLFGPGGRGIPRKTRGGKEFFVPHWVWGFHQLAKKTWPPGELDPNRVDPVLFRRCGKEGWESLLRYEVKGQAEPLLCLDWFDSDLKHRVLEWHVVVRVVPGVASLESPGSFDASHRLAVERGLEVMPREAYRECLKPLEDLTRIMGAPMPA